MNIRRVYRGHVIWMNHNDEGEWSYSVSRISEDPRALDRPAPRAPHPLFSSYRDACADAEGIIDRFVMTGGHPDRDTAPQFDAVAP